MRLFRDITTGYTITYTELKEHLEHMNGSPLTDKQVENWIFLNSCKNGGNCEEIHQE